MNLNYYVAVRKISFTTFENCGIWMSELKFNAGFPSDFVIP